MLLVPLPRGGGGRVFFQLPWFSFFLKFFQSKHIKSKEGGALQHERQAPIGHHSTVMFAVHQFSSLPDKSIHQAHRARTDTAPSMPPFFRRHLDLDSSSSKALLSRSHSLAHGLVLLAFARGLLEGEDLQQDGE